MEKFKKYLAYTILSLLFLATCSMTTFIMWLCFQTSFWLALYFSAFLGLVVGSIWASDYIVETSGDP